MKAPHEYLVLTDPEPKLGFVVLKTRVRNVHLVGVALAKIQRAVYLSPDESRIAELLAMRVRKWKKKKAADNQSRNIS